MCGIVGYTGKRNSQLVLMDGLSRLEYRGYDSAGIALVRPSGIDVYKAQGHLSNLAARLENAGGAPGNPLPVSRSYLLGHPW